MSIPRPAAGCGQSVAVTATRGRDRDHRGCPNGPASWPASRSHRCSTDPPAAQARSSSTAFPHDHSALGVHGGAMRLIHTSDWHLGRTLHGENLLPYQERFLCWLLDESVRHQAGAVVVAGDIYDRAVPPLDAVRLLDAALLRFAQARIPVIITSGNHDSAVRLGFGARLSESAGIHLRTSVADITRPVVLTDEDGQVAIYGVPYLLPDAVMEELGVAPHPRGGPGRGGPADQGRRRRRGIGRTVVAAHAFVTGGQPAESERDIRVGGIADVPAGRVRRGYLRRPRPSARPAEHRRRDGTTGEGGDTRLRDTRPRDTRPGHQRRCDPVLRVTAGVLVLRAGQRKSVTLADIDAAGQVTTRSWRPRCRGRCGRCAGSSMTCSPGPTGGSRGPGRRVGQGRADRHDQAGLADGTAAREVAAHAGA